MEKEGGGGLDVFFFFAHEVCSLFGGVYLESVQIVWKVFLHLQNKSSIKKQSE